MMKTREETVKEFHEAFDDVVDGELSAPLIKLRAALLDEEHDELQEALDNVLYDICVGGEPDDTLLENLFKEMADLQYVLSGLAVTFGFPLEEVFNEVHESNMTKLDMDGVPILREDGKIMKGPYYVEPDLWQYVLQYKREKKEKSIHD